MFSYHRNCNFILTEVGFTPLRNTCHGPRTSLPQHTFHPTDHVQQDISPTDNPSQSVRKTWEGEARHRVGLQRGRLPSSVCQSLCGLVMQSSTPAPGTQSPWVSVMGAIEDSISQSPFPQMTYTAENPQLDGITSPGTRPRFRPSCRKPPHNVPRTHDNRMTGRQMSCCQQTAPPQSSSNKDVTAHPHWPGASLG